MAVAGTWGAPFPPSRGRPPLQAAAFLVPVPSRLLGNSVSGRRARGAGASENVWDTCFLAEAGSVCPLCASHVHPARPGPFCGPDVHDLWSVCVPYPQSRHPPPVRAQTRTPTLRLVNDLWTDERTEALGSATRRCPCGRSWGSARPVPGPSQRLAARSSGHAGAARVRDSKKAQSPWIVLRFLMCPGLV